MIYQYLKMTERSRRVEYEVLEVRELRMQMGG